MTESQDTARPARKRRKLSRRRKLMFALFAMLLGLLVTEGILQVVCLVFPQVHYAISDDKPPPTVDDDVLGLRPNPMVSEHDSAGWRNPERLSQADIVCIGDSQTYGTSCSRDAAWPIALGRLVGRSSYSMAYGSYGPSHYYALTPEALALKPKLLVVAIYAGNDLADSYNMVYGSGRGSMPELRRNDAETAALLKRAGQMKHGLGAGWNKLQSIVDPPSGMNEPSFRHKLSTWFRLYGVVRTINKRLHAASEHAKDADPKRMRQKWEKRKKMARDLGEPDTLFVYEQNGVNTLLTARARDEVMDLDDPRIALGMRVSKDALDGIIALAEGKAQLVVVFIPTKEYVFYPSAKAAYGKVPPALEKLYVDETRLWNEFRQFLALRHVPCFEMLPALRKMVTEGKNPYPDKWGGHPEDPGNAAMAQALADSQAVKDALAD